jgi:hypothetical protein
VVVKRKIMEAPLPKIILAGKLNLKIEKRIIQILQKEEKRNMIQILRNMFL